MSWLQELLNPSLKCKRIGHQHRTRTYNVYLTPDFAKTSGCSSWTFNTVAVSAECSEDFCPRCKTVHNRSYHAITHLQGLTMDTDSWRELREKGVVRA